MVFGAVLLTGMSNGNNSNNLTNIASENYAADGGEDLIGSDNNNNNNNSAINLDDPVVNEEPLFYSNDYAELPKTPYPTWSYSSSIPTLEPSKYLRPLVQPTTDLSSSSMFPTTIASSIDPTTTVIVQYTTDPTQQPSSVSPTEETITYNPTDSPAERPSSTSPTEIEVTYNPSPSPTEIEVTYNPTQSPPVRPSPTPLDTIITISPTDVIDAPVTTSNPTATATEPTTSSPTQSPTNTPTEPEPIDLTSTLPYFNYDTQSPYGPNQWQNILLDNSTRTNYWSEFNLVENQCNSMDGMQSPIDVCTQPERHCKEYHEFRSKVSLLCLAKNSLVTRKYTCTPAQSFDTTVYLIYLSTHSILLMCLYFE